MPHSFGYRARTRDLFARKYRKRGPLPANKYLQVYKLGQFVDVVGDGSVQKGMPHKFYHGKTGVVWNVTKRAIGVEINKRVGNRIIPKRIHVRVEHVRPSRCREDFEKRCQANALKKIEAKKTKKRVLLKRLPTQPKKAETISIEKSEQIETLYPHAYPGLEW